MTPRNRFPVRRLTDGRAMLNVGSSAHVAPGWNDLDFSWIIRLARYPRLCALLHRKGLLSAARYERIQRVNPETVLWDLRKGIPFADGVFDCVYHSHVLEHIDREDSPAFLRECYRVLRAGGILRVAVPDLELLARQYLEALSRADGEAGRARHREAAEAIFDQMVVRVPRWRAEQPWVVRVLERMLIGNTDRAGVLHRWMYDRLSLAELLSEVGFTDVRSRDAHTSGVADWRAFNLDTNPDGTVYKPDSLFIEATRP